MTAIRLENIHKRFKPRKLPVVDALQGVSLVLEEGESVAFTGHNGAGKTTLLKIISTVIIPNQGKGSVFDIPFKEHREIRKHIGLLAADERSFFWRLSGRQNLHFFGALQNMSRRLINERIDELAELFEVDYLDRRFDQCSTGMRHHIALLRCLLHKPRLLLLDEPTRSMDIESTLRFQDRMHKMVKSGDHTLAVVTHNHTLARTLCQRVLTFEKGVVSEDRPTSELKGEVALMYEVSTEVLSAMEAASLYIAPEVCYVVTEPKLGRSRLQTRPEPAALTQLMQRLTELKIPIFDIRPLEGEPGVMPDR